MTRGIRRPMVLAVVGMSGVGKSEAVTLLCEHLDAPLVYFGGLVVDEVQRRGLSGPAAEQKVRNELRSEHGMGAIAKLALPAIHEEFRHAPTVVIDGVYSRAEEDLLRTEFGEVFRTLAIHSPKAARYRRLATRPHRPLAPTEVDRRDSDEIARLDKANPILLADYHIVNDATLEELAAHLIRIVDTVAETGLADASPLSPRPLRDSTGRLDDG